MVYKVYLVTEEWWDEENEHEGYTEARHVDTCETKEEAEKLMDKMYLAANS